MKILGVDPGSRRTGWGVVSVRGSRLRHIDSGVINAAGDDFATRLASIADALDEILVRHAPERVVIEAVFHHKNSQSALKLGQARGAVLVCVARAKVAVREYTPAEIKRGVTGNGNATKAQVQKMVKLLLRHDGELGLDASDALAMAICYANTGKRLEQR